MHKSVSRLNHWINSIEEILKSVGLTRLYTIYNHEENLHSSIEANEYANWTESFQIIGQNLAGWYSNVYKQCLKTQSSKVKYNLYIDESSLTRLSKIVSVSDTPLKKYFRR